VEAEQQSFAVGELGSFSGSFTEPAGTTSLEAAGLLTDPTF